MHKKAFLSILIVFLFSCFIYANNISDQLYNSFLEQNIIPEKQFLLNAESTLFPYNVIINSNCKTNILISVEDALFCTEQLSKLSNNFNIICTTNNISKLGFLEYSNNGLQTFLEKSSFAKAPTVILELSKNTNSSVQVVPGTQGFVTSKYCLEKLLSSFNKNRQSFKIEAKSISVYKLGLVESDEQMIFLFNNDCNIVKIKMSENLLSKIIPSLQDFTNKYDTEDSENFDYNYAFLSGFNSSFFLSEFTLTFIFIISVGVALFFICMLSFMFGKKALLRKKTMLKYWGLGPLFLILIVLSYYFSQFIVLACLSNYESNMLLAYLSKLILTLFFICLAFAFVKELKLPQKRYAYAYLMPVVSIANIFIFSAVHLPLLPLFIFEFFIAYFTQRIKKTYLLIIAFILMGIPFYPTAVSLFSGIPPESLNIFVNSNFIVNILLSFISLPFMFMFRRIILSIKTKSFQKNKRKTKSLKSIYKIAIFFVLFLTVIIILIVQNQKIKNDFQIQENSFAKTPDENLFDVQILQEQIFSTCKNLVTLTSNSKIDLYTVKIESTSDFPIYSANFPFEYNIIQDSVDFKLAENPPNPLQIEFLTDFGSDYLIQIEGFSKTEKTIATKLFQSFVAGKSQ